MTGYKIENNVPIPAARSTALRETLSKLRPKQSFVVPRKDVKTKEFSPPYQAAKDLGMKISVRKVDDPAGWRIWRIK